LPGGEFYFKVPGLYVIEKLYYKSTVGSSWADVWLVPGRRLVFGVETSSVNIFGPIRASYDWRATNMIGSYAGWDIVRSTFLKQFPDSKWGKQMWRHCVDPLTGPS